MVWTRADACSTPMVAFNFVAMRVTILPVVVWVAVGVLLWHAYSWGHVHPEWNLH